MGLKIINETDVTVETLADHLEASGWSADLSEKGSLTLLTENGLAFKVRIDRKRKFVVLMTSLPIRCDFLDTLDYCNDLNLHVFLGSYSIDSERDLDVSYPMSYERGLIAPQFMRIVIRFASIIEYIVSKDQDKNIFDFNKDSTDITTSPAPALLQ